MVSLVPLLGMLLNLMSMQKSLMRIKVRRLMKITLYHVDAFTDKIFSGNPAAVCVMSEWLSDKMLHKIAKENNLPVTAFLVIENGTYHIRWIIPEYELDICGHGSLSAGYVIFNFISPGLQRVDLHSRTEVLPVILNEDLVTLNFPAKNIDRVTALLRVNLLLCQESLADLLAQYTCQSYQFLCGADLYGSQ